MGELTQVLPRWRERWSRAAQAIRAQPDVVGQAVVLAPALCLLVVLDIAQGEIDQLPITLLYAVSTFFMFTLPVFMIALHRWRQEKVLSRVRSLYALAVEWLMQERADQARRALRSIRRWEQHWRIGNSLSYRLAYSACVLAATTANAAVHFLTYAFSYSHFGYLQRPHATLLETALYLIDHPIQLWLYGFFCLVVGLASFEHLRDLKGETWAEFYGDRLERALNAGRKVATAPHRRGRRIPGNVAARELLGLPAQFTSAELHRAWLKLARELHPDRWATAGDDVRQLKEAALKRVNAARDELKAQAVDYSARPRGSAA